MKQFVILLGLCVAAGTPVAMATQRKPASKPASGPGAAARAGSRPRGLESTLRLEEKIAQLVMIPINGAFPNARTREYRRLVRLIRDVRVGGMVLVNVANGRLVRRAEPYELAAFLNRAQRLAQIPLIVGGDFERGASMRVDSTTVFPHAMAFGAAGDPNLTRFLGENTARESRAMGVHWIYFPVADVNNNPDNPIINIRSFGEDPAQVAAHVRAFIEGAQSAKDARVLTCAKHFPGHGDTATDSHMGMAVISGDRARLDKVELVPFRAAIAQGVDSIMSAHIAVPELDPSRTPATLSPVLLDGLLRKDLGFRGIVVTDALEMGGIVKGHSPGEAAVRALEAGADVLLMPPDPEAAIRAVAAAVRSGRLRAKRIDESLTRLLNAKRSLGLFQQRTVSTDAIAEAMNSPEAAEHAQQVAERAVTLIRNEGGIVPLDPAGNPCVLVLTENRRSTQGQALFDELAKVAPSAKVLTLDPGMTTGEMDAAAETSAGCPVTVVAAYVSVAAYRGDVVLAGQFPYLMTKVLASTKPVVLVTLGSPYLLRSFSGVAAYIATFSTVAPSEIAAARALFGVIPFRGHMPVTIPGRAELGAGLTAVK